MSAVANADEAARCLEIARSALQTGNTEKAARFAEKAMKLHPHDEARKVLRAVRSQTAQPSSSSTTSGTRPPSGSSSVRQRAAAAASEASPLQSDDSSTPEERELVRSILAKKDDLYAVLGVSRTAGEDDIKKAYRKLALKLHPDKNKAQSADEAFKVVSKAFSCLSDSDKRSRYDRYGEEVPGLSRTRSGRARPDEFDPDEIFRAFFGGRGGPMFRAQGPFGGPFGHFPAEGGSGQGQNPLFGLLTVVPIVLFLLFSFLSSPKDPVWMLDRSGGFVYELSTNKLNVPFFVKSVTDLDREYPVKSVYRLRLEQEVEGAYQERLQRRCFNEQMEQRRLYSWGQSARAQGMKLDSCKEYTERFGSRYHTPYVYGF